MAGTRWSTVPRWKVVILPAADTCPWRPGRTWRGSCGRAAWRSRWGLPRNSEVEFPCPSAQALARDLFGDSGERPRGPGNPRGGGGIYLPAGSESLLPIVLSGVLAPDVVPGDRNAPLRATHRRIDGHEVYFVINDSPRPWRGPLSVASRGDGRRWDPATGMISNLSGAMPIDLSLEPYGATLLRFSQPPAPARRRLTSGDLPNLTERPLPLEVPVAAHGEFVRAEVAPEAGVAGGPVTRYRADATLTRAKVDTFLFLRFHARSPLGLSADDCLVIDSWLPEGQRTANRLLVILHEEGGGDFLATTSRGLGRPGHERTFVPLNQFQHAAWTQDSDGVLDLTRVSDVSVGWGGYLGAEGEPVRFDVTPPMAGSTAAQKAR
ncbi:MAG: hypothetical protein U0790_07315 [Isosphaeraceae bacterium]